MKPSDSLDLEMISYFLRQIIYWRGRFENSRHIEHLDRAERHAEALRDYLPRSLEELSQAELINLCCNLPYTQVHSEKDHP